MKRLVIAAAALAAFGCDRGWNKELPPAGELGSPRGYFVARGTVHLHSPYSHDACDGDGLPGGAVNEGCYQGLREALCLNRMDFAMLTDHPAHMAEYEFEDLLLPRAGDVLVPGAEGPVANEMFCENGARPLVTVGFEDNLMPVGMERHLDPDPVVRNQLYNADGPAIGARLKDEAGAVLWVPHTESRSIDYLRTLGHQGMEIYQIHANLDPDIRVEWLGLDAFSGIAALIPYLFDAFSAPVPDLAFLSFFYLSPVYAEKWNALTDEGLRIAASVGCDSHQNVLNLQGIDGDRMDAHRRVLRWTSDHYLVTDYTFDAVKESLAAARGWIVFEILGSPVGMDFYADADGDVIGVG
ncbi:MAG: hypothetical protein K8I02_04260, partial [Candidatus Methylomirabilis sp.]|nr:hypothetical protein [Deltaproteobacteria bacterium]